MASTGDDDQKNALGTAVVVMVPFPAQGHLNQLLHLSRLLAARGVAVHFTGSPTHNRQARLRLGGWDLAAFPNIRFHDLPVPPFSSPRPDPHAAAVCNFPSHLQPAFDACLRMQEPLAALLRSLSAASRRVAVVHDSLMSFAAQEAAALPNGEAYVFHSVSAFANLLFQWAAGRGEDDCRRLLHSLLGPNCRRGIVPPVDGCFTEDFMDFIRCQYENTPPPAGRLFNTCRPVEGNLIDHLAREPNFKHGKYFAVGPVNPVSAQTMPSCRGSNSFDIFNNYCSGSTDFVMMSKSNKCCSDSTDSIMMSKARHDQCMAWLDQQPPISVVYVCFGTTSSMHEQQIKELAEGLERSRQRFIWVLRDADRADIFAGAGEDDEGKRQELPEGYEERVAGVGLVVRGWAPQLEILGHRATALFLSHCGWNSCMEGLSNGVPMAAWPLHSDQPKNAMLVTEVLQAGVAVRDWERRSETVTADAVAGAIRRAMDSPEGRLMRTRAKDLGETIRRAVSQGGSSYEELGSFIAHINRY